MGKLLAVAALFIIFCSATANAYDWVSESWYYGSGRQGVCYNSHGPVVLAFSPQSASFGNVTTGQTSTPVEFTLENSGESAASGLYIGLAAPFSVDATTCGTTLAAGSSCTVSVVASPTQTGVGTGELSANYTGGSATSAGLDVTGVTADPYTYVVVSRWDGVDILDTGGTGVGIPWTSSTGSNGALANGAYEVTLAASKTANYVSKTLSVAENEIKLRGNFKISTVTQPSTNNTSIFELRSGTATVAFVTIKATTTTLNQIYIRYRDGSNTLVNSPIANFAWTANEFHTIDLRFKESSNTSTSDGYYHLFVDNSELLTQTAINTYQYNAISVLRAGIIISDLNLTETVSFDDVELGGLQ